MPAKSEGKKASGEDSAAGTRGRGKQAAWSLPPMAWILSSTGGSRWELPSRVLVCGLLSEIGPLAKALPEAEVVVVAPSEDQVRVVRTACSRRKLRNVRVECGTAGEEGFAGLVGSNFDLVLAPGVFRGLPEIGPTMRNLVECLSKPRGALFVECDAAHHPASRTAAILAQFPVEPADATPERIHALASGMCGVRPLPPAVLPDLPARCWPLERWIEAAAVVGLHPAACTLPQKLLPVALPFGGMGLLTCMELIPLCRLLEAIAAPPVLQLVFGHEPLIQPPWSSPALLADWRPLVQFWPRKKVPVMAAPYTNGVELGIDIPGILEPQKLQITAFLLEFLRLSDGETSIGGILDAIPYEAKVEDVVNALFFFHHTSIARLLPPA